MARPRKDGIDYFSFDTDFFADKKIKILKAKYGLNGVGIYIFLLCEIYKNGYYLAWDEDYKYILADELSLKDDFVEQVLKFLVERSLFDNKLFYSDNILTSKGIQKRFQLAVKERAKKNHIAIEEFWVLSEEETEYYINLIHEQSNSMKNDSNSRNNKGKIEVIPGKKYTKESKEKESKENQSKEIKEVQQAAVYFENEELNRTFLDFVDMRKKIKNGAMTERAIKMMIDKISKYSIDTAIKMLEQSILNNWKDIYELKTKEIVEAVHSSNQKNKFCNFEQRNYEKNKIKNIEQKLLEKALSNVT